MKRLFSVLALITCYSTLLFSQIFRNADDNPNFHLSIEPTFGYSSGQLDEIIYHSSNKSKKISLLEWKRNLWLYGANIETQYKRFHFDLGFDTSIHTKCGEMRDSDWLNTRNYEMKTTYSVGDIDALENYDCKISLSFDAVKNKDFYIAPIIQAQYKFDSFSRGKNAEGWYGNESSDGKFHWWYEDEAKHYPTEYYWSESKKKYVRQVLAGIDYYRHSVFTWFGFETGFYMKKFNFNFSMLLSPFYYLSAEDTHHAGNIFRFIQQDYFSAFDFSFGLSYSLNKAIDFTLKSEMLGTKTIKGNLYDEGWHLNISQPSGANVFEFTTKLGCRVKFL